MGITKFWNFIALPNFFWASLTSAPNPKMVLLLAECIYWGKPFDKLRVFFVFNTVQPERLRLILHVPNNALPTCKIKSSIVQTSWQRTIADLHKSVRGFMNIINLIPAISTRPQLWESEHDLPLQCMFVSQACLSVYMILLSNFTRNLITTAIKAPAPGTFNKSENCQCSDNLCLWHLDLHPQPDLCITVYELNKQLDVVSDAGGRSSGWFIIQTQIISSWNLLPAAGLAIPQLLQYPSVQTWNLCCSWTQWQRLPTHDDEDIEIFVHIFDV